MGGKDGHPGVIHKFSRFAAAYPPKMWSKGGIVKALVRWATGKRLTNRLPTQTKPYNTLPPFEQRDSWSSYGAVRAYSEVLL